MLKSLLPYALLLAVGAFALQWLEQRYTMRTLPLETYVGIAAVAFALLGLWAGYELTRRWNPKVGEVNEQAIDALGLSPREMDVLKALVDGQSNKEIARTLHISPNTVKTHVARVFEKLEVQRRTQAITEARRLGIAP